MENELVKKLCSKQGFEQSAFEIINKPNVEAFEALVEKSEFLFDFVKQNVVKRLQNCINKDNYKNLLSFLKYYCADYEDFIVSNLKKFGDADLKVKMSELLQNGTDSEKTYCVKFFEDDLNFVPTFRDLSDSEFEPLAYNSAVALGKIKDETSFHDALKNLNSADDFSVMTSIEFLSAYGDKRALPYMFEAMKNSSMSENIACEIVYTEDIFELLAEYPNETNLLINNIISGLGEVVPLSIIFNIQLYDLIEQIIFPLTLLHLKQKIEQLTENDEYLFDEDKSVKDEIIEVKKLLNSKPYWDNLCDELELKDDEFVFFNLQMISEYGLDYSDEIMDLIRNTSNQAVILKSVEVMKEIGQLSKLSKDEVLSKVSDETIRAVLISYYE